jgi:hypothetical protein
VLVFCISGRFRGISAAQRIPACQMRLYSGSYFSPPSLHSHHNRNLPLIIVLVMEKSRYAVSPAPPAQAAPIPAPEELAPPPAPAKTAPPPQAEAVYEQAYNMDPSIDEFAQTRPPDDLFDDDFVPIPESEPIPDPTPVTHHPEQIQLLRDPPRGPRGHGGKRGGTQRGGRTSPPSTAPPTATAPAPTAAPAATAEQEGSADTAATPKVERKEGAVRGDRSGTGGVKKVFHIIHS